MAQFYWFQTPAATVALLWKAGRANPENYDPLATLHLPEAFAKTVKSVTANKIASGENLVAQLQNEDGGARLENLAFNGDPLAIVFTTK